MALIYTLLGFFIIKGLFIWPFYYRQRWRPLLVGLSSSLAFAPLMSLLYHETDISFNYVYLTLILLDAIIYNTLLQPTWWKSLLIAFFLNSIMMVWFVIGNS